MTTDEDSTYLMKPLVVSNESSQMGVGSHHAEVIGDAHQNFNVFICTYAQDCN